MKRQGIIHQMKEQEKTPEKQLNEVEKGNLPEKEFRIMIMKMIQDLGEKNGGKDKEDARITEAEEWISELEDRRVEFTAAEQNKEKRMKRNEDSLRDPWENIKHNNICIIGVSEGEIGRASCRERV